MNNTKGARLVNNLMNEMLKKTPNLDYEDFRRLFIERIDKMSDDEFDKLSNMDGF